MTSKPTKEQIVTLLYAWIAQRPGLDFANYGDVANYRSESRRITRQGHDARQLVRAVEMSSMTAEQLLEGFRAYSGRLTIEEHPTKPGSFRLDYCTGQYWPTEYRAAAAAVCASALWNYARESMPAANGKVKRISGVGTFAHETEHDSIDGLSPGDWLRRNFRRQFGATMQKRWFD